MSKKFIEFDNNAIPIIEIGTLYKTMHFSWRHWTQYYDVVIKKHYDKRKYIESFDTEQQRDKRFDEIMKLLEG